MRDATKQELERNLPSVVTPHQAIQFCLDQLCQERKKRLADYVAGVCTYEELIGALLLAKYRIQELEAEVDDDSAPMSPGQW